MDKRWGLLIVALAASTASPGDPPSKSAAAGEGIERSAEFVHDVNAAIDRGVAWLRSAQARNGSFPDFENFSGATTALAYTTLRACGVAKDDIAAVRSWDALSRAYRPTELRTYGAAMYLMAIASHGERVPDADRAQEIRVSARDAAWAAEIVRFLSESQRETGVWGYNTPDVPGGLQERPGYYDHSNTQCALLGLACAARCGVPVDAAVWRKSLVHFVAAQEREGPAVRRDGAPIHAEPQVRGRTTDSVIDHARGWGYKSCNAPDNDGPKTSMTAGGVSSLVLCRDELVAAHAIDAQLAEDAERAIRDGIAWTGTDWPHRLKPKDVEPYAAYSVERAGMLSGVDRMAGFDWYGEGARALLAVQQPDGSWCGRGYPKFTGDAELQRRATLPVDTCFALLFLKRASLRGRLNAVTPGADGDALDFGAASSLDARGLGEFLDVVLARWRRATDERVCARLLDEATAIGPRVVEPLIERLDAADVGRREAANALLRRATGLDFAFIADGPAGAREAAALRWQAWWMKAKDRLAYEPATRRLVVR